MPIYEYLCDDCGERYEQIVMSKRTVVACPKCESKKKTVQLSVFAAPANGKILRWRWERLSYEWRLRSFLRLPLRARFLRRGIRAGRSDAKGRVLKWP